MKILAGFLAFISSFFAVNSPSNQSPPPLNTAIITYSKTYFAPAIAEPGNFPWAKKSKTEKENIVIESAAPLLPTPKPVLLPPPPPKPIVTLPPAPPSDPYLANPEPIENWFRYSSFNGNSDDSDRTLPEIIFDREYWRIEVLAYWAPKVNDTKPEIQKDYFKLEVYEKGTNKIIYTMTSGSEETIHKFQSFKKPGTYYFKIYSKNPSQYEIYFTISSKLAAQ